MSFSFRVVTALAAFAVCASFAYAQNAQDCSKVPDYNKLKTALSSAVKEGKGANGGLGNQEWGTVVNRDGIVCAVVFTGPNRGAEWPGSRLISAEKPPSLIRTERSQSRVRAETGAGRLTVIPRRRAGRSGKDRSQRTTGAKDLIKTPRDLRGDALGPGLEFAQVALAVWHLTSHLSQRPIPLITQSAQPGSSQLTRSLRVWDAVHRGADHLPLPVSTVLAPLVDESDDR